MIAFRMKPWQAAVLAFVGGLAILVSVTAVIGSPEGIRGDGEQYLALGQSLAAGRGYRDTVGPWPQDPSYDRMPGWPAVLAVSIWLAPGISPTSVALYANAVCLSAVGALFTLLCMRVGVRVPLSLVGGLGVSLSPPLVFLSLTGFSEIVFLLSVAAGLLAVLAGGFWFYLGALVLGLAPLVRTNFVIMPLVFLGLALVLPGARRALLRKAVLVRTVCALCIFVLPTLAWALRNYSLTGRFPLLSSIEGETLYGANNDITANELASWGYWVMPDRIAGEVPKLQLARRLGSDLELNDYYHRRALDWIRRNVPSLPRLVLGKLVRAFVPVPWVPQLASYVAFSYRLLLFALCLVLSSLWWRAIDRTYLLFCSAMFGVLLVTTAVYYGSFRFTHCLAEVFFIPCIVKGFECLLARRGYGKPSPRAEH